MHGGGFGRPFALGDNLAMARVPGLLLLIVWGSAGAAETIVYKCPGPPVLYTDAMSAAEAKLRNCKPVEGTPITIIQSPRPRPAAVPAAAASGSAETRVSANEQKARDSDARRILEAELARAQDKLGALQRDYNNGEPERLGNERNYQKYIDRVAEMKAAIARTQADIEAIKREIAKLPS